MKNLDEVMVLAVVVKNNLMGSYFLQINDEEMNELFILQSVKEYADYVRLNRKFIDASMWFMSPDIKPDLMYKIRNEVDTYKDIFMITNETFI